MAVGRLRSSSEADDVGEDRWRVPHRVPQLSDEHGAETGPTGDGEPLLRTQHHAGERRTGERGR